MKYFINNTVIGTVAGTLLAGAAMADVESLDPIKLTLHD